MPECFAYKSHLALDINGYRIPCCMYRSTSGHDPLVTNHWTDITFEQYKNLPEFVNLQQTMESGEWHPGCRECKKQEETFGSSLRTGNNKELTHKKQDPSSIEYIEISLSNFCNISCRMCAPNWSTDYIKKIERNPNLLDFVDFGTKDCSRIKYDVNELFDPVDLSNVKIIKYIGGEPFVTPEIGSLFEYLDTRIDLSQTKLFINTNATFWPEKYLHYLNKFHTVFCTISIDGVGERDDYIRDGSKWSTKLKNIKKFKKQGFNMSGHTVLSALNIDQYTNLVEFGKTYFGKPPHFTPCTSPEYLNLNALPPAYVKQLCKNNDVSIHFKDYKFDTLQFERLKKFTQEFDKTSGKSIEKYIPKLADHLLT